MFAAPTVWGNIWPYGYIQDKAGVAWKILEEKQGWMLLVNAQGQQASMMRPVDNAPVTALLYTDEEAWAALYRAFPGAQIINIEQTGA